jgi:hypothetical protein
MSSSSSNAPNGLPWLAEDNSVEWQEQVMAYLQQKQLAQYVEGWASYLAPSPPTVLTNAERVDPVQVQTYDAAVTKWRTTYDDWRIKDNMAMGVIKGTLRGQYLTYVLHCATSKAVWDTILGRLKTQNLGLAAHNTKQLLYSHPYLGGLIEEYLKHFIVTNKQLAHIGKALPDADVAHWMLENLPKDDPSWKSVISSFYMVNPDPDVITTLQVSVAIRNHYNQLTAPSSHSTSAYVAPTFESVFVARHGRPPSGPNRPYCNGCKKPGHTVENCFESILAEIGKLNARLPCSLQLSVPSRPERANVVLEGGFGVVDDRDTPGGDDDVALLSMALSRGEVFVSTSLSRKVRSAYHDHAYVDSGATHSISPVIEYFDPASLKQLKSPVVIRIGNNDTLLATAAGDMPFLFNVGDTVKRGVVTNVLYCADIATTLISASQLNARGNRVVLDGSESRIVHKPSGEMVARMHLTSSGLYRLDASPCPSKVSVSLTASLRSLDINDLHRRLGHLAFDECKKLVYRGLIEGVDALCGRQVFCPGCVEGKIHRAPFHISNSVTTNKLHRIHSDLAGPFPFSIHGCRYFVVFFDEFSKKLWVYFMARKSEMFVRFKEWKAMAELQLGHLLQEFQSDNGGEYTGTDFRAYLRSSGILHRTSTAYTPQQNGKAERSIRTILEHALSMLRSANLSDGFWQDAVGTAVHLINRSTRTGLKRMTPEESWSGTKPDIANLRVFGCPGYVLIPKELRVGKLAHKTRRCVFIGYSSTWKAWRFWNPVKRSVIESRDVVFDKRVQCCGHPVSPVDLSSLKCAGGKGVTATDASPVTDADIPISHPTVDPHLAVPLVGPLPLVDPLPAPPMRQRRLNEVKRLFDYFEHHPLRDEGGGAQIEGDIVDEELEQGLWASMLALEHGLPDDTVEDVGVLAVTTGANRDISIAPSSLHEALQGSDATEWTEAIRWEMDSLTHTNTFVEVDQVPTPFTPIGSKFVFSLKRDVSGKVIRYKARLVAQGFSQREGIDYTSTFAPVVRLTSIRITLAIATNLNLKMDHLDVETTFLNGRIDEEIYMWAPRGFEKLGLDVGNLWRLHGLLYGLKQALLIWNKLLDRVLKSFGWHRLSSDWCIYIWHDSGGRFMILAVHVDDMLLAGNSCELMEEAKAWLVKHFKIKDMGDPRLMVGLEIIRNEG